jgi:hypothetical protein
VIEGAAILLLGMLIGWIVRSLAMRRKAQPQIADPVAICGCTHHYSFHDGEGCHHEFVRWVNGVPTPRGCSCKKYVGPEPLPTMTAGT